VLDSSGGHCVGRALELHLVWEAQGLRVAWSVDKHGHESLHLAAKHVAAAVVAHRGCAASSSVRQRCSGIARSAGFAAFPVDAFASAKFVEIIVVPLHARLAGKSTEPPVATTSMPPVFATRTTLS